jgi:hypothetical protein
MRLCGHWTNNKYPSVIYSENRAKWLEEAAKQLMNKSINVKFK